MDGLEVTAHLPNSGRMTELLVSGQHVVVAGKYGEHRKTAYDMILVDLGDGLVSVDSRLPSQVVEEALLSGTLAPFGHCGFVRREVVYGDSRLDFRVGANGREYLVEVKSVNLVEGKRALFPDAPTLRGARHLRTLVKAVREGYGAAVIFVVQREDASAFSPHEKADPDFGRALREAAEGGVGLYAYRCRLTREEIELSQEIPVILERG